MLRPKTYCFLLQAVIDRRAVFGQDAVEKCCNFFTVREIILPSAPLYTYIQTEGFRQIISEIKTIRRVKYNGTETRIIPG